ncbi:unnamed protein product [Boreogadus saida]
MATGEDRRELVEVRKKAELGLLDVAVTPTSKCGKGQRRKIPNSKNLEPSEDGNDEHVAEPKTKSKRKQASTAQSASKSILQKYKNAQGGAAFQRCQAQVCATFPPRDVESGITYAAGCCQARREKASKPSSCLGPRAGPGPQDNDWF